jgi:uncharacterized membrane protein
VIFVVLILGLSIGCRFANLGNKVFWGDEVYSATRIAGFSQTEIIDRLYTGRPIRVADLAQLQAINSEKTFADALQVMVTDAPHHPAPYYILARLWEQLWGSSIAVKRTLPVLISLLAFPALYWLCQELFGSLFTSGIAIALFAVSPIQLLYAQEVRSYSLWVVTTLLSSAALLRALRVKTYASWSVYALTIAACLYSHLFGLAVLGIHGVYTFITAWWVTPRQFGQTVRRYVLGAIGGLLLFAPWIWVFVAYEPVVSRGWGWVIAKTSPVQLFQTWINNLSYTFFDLPLRSDPFQSQLSASEPATYLALFSLGLLAYAVYVLCRTTSIQTWLFILLLMLFTALPLAVPDLLSGGVRSTIPRYQLPSYLGIQLTVAYLLSFKLTSPALQRRFWQGMTAIVLTLGMLSCLWIAQSTATWTKYSDYHNLELAAAINQYAEPLVLSDSDWNRILALSHLLKPHVQLQLVFKTSRDTAIPADQVPVISGSYSDVLLLETQPPRPLLRQALQKQQGARFRRVYQEAIGFKERRTTLWQINFDQK